MFEAGGEADVDFVHVARGWLCSPPGWSVSLCLFNLSSSFVSTSPFKSNHFNLDMFMWIPTQDPARKSSKRAHDERVRRVRLMHAFATSATGADLASHLRSLVTQTSRPPRMDNIVFVLQHEVGFTTRMRSPCEHSTRQEPCQPLTQLLNQG